jgi:hypothetical protein
MLLLDILRLILEKKYKLKRDKYSHGLISFLFLLQNKIELAHKKTI